MQDQPRPRGWDRESSARPADSSAPGSRLNLLGLALLILLGRIHREHRLVRQDRLFEGAETVEPAGKGPAVSAGVAELDVIPFFDLVGQTERPLHVVDSVAGGPPQYKVVA